MQAIKTIKLRRLQAPYERWRFVSNGVVGNIFYPFSEQYLNHHFIQEYNHVNISIFFSLGIIKEKSRVSVILQKGRA